MDEAKRDLKHMKKLKIEFAEFKSTFYCLCSIL